MANTEYMSRPMMDWSGEIKGGPAASAHTSTTTTTTTSSTAAAAPGTTTTTTASSYGAPSASYPETPGTMRASAPAANGAPASYPAASGAVRASAPAYRSEFEGSIGTLDLQTHQPIEVIEAPTGMNEAFLGSLKAMLLRNRGNFITATFLIGTQGTTAWEGILHDVGNDYLVIYQPGRQRYIACDIYSLKYIEFYDTKQQQLCGQILRDNGWRNQY